MAELNMRLIETPDTEALLCAYASEGADLLFVGWMFGDSDRSGEFSEVRRQTVGTPIVALLDELQGHCKSALVSSGVQETLSLHRLTSVDILRVVTRAMCRGIRAKMLGAEISLLNAYDKTLERLSLIDPLTGLSNRKRFSSLADEAIARSKTNDSGLAVLYFDIDQFKLLNNSYGYEIGDQALCRFAHRVCDQLNTSRNFARIGGDEFVLLVEDIRDAEEPFRLAQRIHKAISAPAELSGNQVSLSISIGIACSAESVVGTEELIRRAGAAIFHAKQSRENGKICVFDPALESRMRADDHMSKALTHSLAAGETSVAYQPIFKYAENRIASAEALFRWPQQPQYDVSEVIALAEANSMIRDVDRCSVVTVLDELSRHPISNLAQVSVNASVLSLDKAYLRELVALVKRRGPLPFRLCLELTETAVSSHFGNMKKLAAELRECNFAVALDDFGTGYASLKYVRELNLDYLKLDRELVRDVEQESSARAICEAAIGMAHSLGVLVVAEGIASEGQFETLRELDCDYAQGYYIAKPESLSQLAVRCAA